LFEGYAPHGIAILVETATDNNNRYWQTSSYFNKCNGTMGTQGSVEFILITCNFRIPAEGLDAEELELELIDFGAEVLKMKWYFNLCLFKFWNHSKELENRNLEILSSGLNEFRKLLNLQKQKWQMLKID
jgi:transcriptional/translational regulatory protein YebC/TACO1